MGRRRGWRMEDRRWRMEDGGWKMEDGGWKMEDGGWRMEDGRISLLQSSIRHPPSSLSPTLRFSVPWCPFEGDLFSLAPRRLGGAFCSKSTWSTHARWRNFSQSTFSMAATTPAGSAGDLKGSSGARHSTGTFPHFSIARGLVSSANPGLSADPQSV